MKTTSQEEKRKAFRALHGQERPIYRVAHATRPNKSEEYKSPEIHAASGRLIARSMETARSVFDIFTHRQKDRT